MFIRLFLISSLIPLQSCSNTRIGEELENSFEVIKNSNISEKTMNVIEQNKPNEIKKINSSNEVDD